MEARHVDDPHKSCALRYAGARWDEARMVVVAAHGRNGVASDILRLASQVDLPDVAWIAPQAAGRSWWPEIFLAPLALNEPGLSSALKRISTIAAGLLARGFTSDQIVLTGFSQGACLMLEHIARHPQPWRGVVAMSGGLLGSGEGDGGPYSALHGHAEKAFTYPGHLARMPVHLGCHEGDPVIPAARVRSSARVLGGMGADVTLEMSPGKMHGIRPDDIAALRRLLAGG